MLSQPRSEIFFYFLCFCFFLRLAVSKVGRNTRPVYFNASNECCTLAENTYLCCCWATGTYILKVFSHVLYRKCGSFQNRRIDGQHSFLVYSIVKGVLCAPMFHIYTECWALERLFLFRSFHNLQEDKRKQTQTFFLSTIMFLGLRMQMNYEMYFVSKNQGLDLCFPDCLD